MIPRRRTRLTRFGLTKLGLTVVLVMSLLGALASSFVPRDPKREAASLFARGEAVDAEAVLVAHLEHARDDVDGFVQLVRQRGHAGGRFATFDDALPDEATRGARAVLGHPGREAHAFSTSDDELLAFASSARGISARALRAHYLIARTGSLDDSLALLESDPPVAADVLEAGRIAMDVGDSARALAILERVVDHEGVVGNDARRAILELLARGHDDDALLARLDDPRFRVVAGDDVLFAEARARDDYAALAQLAVSGSLVRVTAPVVVTCVVAGLAWALFLLVVGAAWEWSRRALVFAALGLIAGVASGMLTLAAVVVMDDVIEHAAREATNAYLFVYCIAGIGFREEIIKLACIAPVVALMRHEKHEGVLLIVASLGGLGFAIEENAGYFTSALGASPVVIGRFLTANFLHLALTGLTGFHFARALQKGGAEWDTFTKVFLQAVLAHGLYDFLLMADLGDGMSYFAMTVFVWLAQRYLVDLIAYFPLKTRPVALSTALTICLAVAVAANFNLVAFEVGVRAALDLTFLGILGNGLVAIVFYRSLGEEIL